MSEPTPSIWIRRLEALEASQRRLRWGMAVLACLVVALAVAGYGRPVEVSSSGAVGFAEANIAGILHGEEASRPALHDPLYDEFLGEFGRLRGDGERRRHLAAQILAAGAEHRVDPDLLFALIAAESSFDSEAVSSKGARGLGQMMFPTALAVAPGVVRQPEDLHDVRRNFYTTALHLRQLMDERGGDLRAALRAYYGGSGVRIGPGHGSDPYVARVSTCYAYLKGRHTYRQFAAAQAVKTGSAKK